MGPTKREYRQTLLKFNPKSLWIDREKARIERSMMRMAEWDSVSPVIRAVVFLPTDMSSGQKLRNRNRADAALRPVLPKHLEPKPLLTHPDLSLCHPALAGFV